MGTGFKVRNGSINRKRLAAPIGLALLLAGCSTGALEQMQTDLLSKDAQWFQQSGRLFIRNIAMCFDNTLAPAGERKHSKTI